jgi:hypothetical protein
MSVRIHQGIPAQAMQIGAVHEADNLGIAAVFGGYGDVSLTFKDTVGDMRANIQGIRNGYIIWKSCEELCNTCQ